MPAEGTAVGGYRLISKIGEGGMGAVYVAEHSLLGRRAAIKMLLPELSARADVVQRFFNEARAATQIADPGIVQVFDFGYHSDGSAFMVMELLAGESLHARIARIGALTLLDAVRITRQMCSTLHAVHAHGIVHRDLKPDNVYLIADPLVTGGERAKILDFGIAKLSGDSGQVSQTQTGQLMGTPVFMSPEQCRGAGEVDHRTDIYSLGCVMMVMLTGRAPFQGNASGDLIVSHMREPPPRPSQRNLEVPQMLDAIVLRCLEKDPGQRFQSMADLSDELAPIERMLLGPGEALVTPPRPLRALTPVLTPMPTPTPQTPTTLGGAAGQTQPPRVSRTGLFIVLGCVVGAIAGGALFLANRDHGTPAAAVAPADAAATKPVVAAPPPVDAPEAPPPPDAAPQIDAGVATPTVVHHPPPPRRPPHRPPQGSAAVHIDRGD